MPIIRAWVLGAPESIRQTELLFSTVHSEKPKDQNTKQYKITKLVETE